MSVEAFLNAQNARIQLTSIVDGMKLSDKEHKLIMGFADVYANATGMLRVNEALEKLNAEVKLI